MENKERQILSEIQDMIVSVRSQLEVLEAKLAELQLNVGTDDVDMTPIDLDIDDFQEVVEEQVVVEEPVEVLEDLTVEDDVVEETVVVESEEIEETVAVEEPIDVFPEDDDDDLPIFADPEPVKESVPVAVNSKPAVIDSMTERQAWRTDMPGTQVKDIRSAISLNDRILFINMLFGQDPMAFQDTLTRINQMSSLDEVVSYVAENKPEWDMDSETVYRFMMAVRRKIR